MRFFILLSLLFITGCGTSMGRYESPQFAALQSEGSFEVREYQPALVAATHSSKENSGFRRLLSFISGNNSGSENISMTIPVRVSSSKVSSEIMFFMPRKYSASSLPQPKDPEVKIKEFSGGTYAAIRFSGVINSKKLSEKSSKLLSWLKSKGYRATDELYLDRYDPPWTLWFSRTNELVVRVVKEETDAES